MTVISHRNAARKLAAAVRQQSPIMVYAHDIWAASAELHNKYQWHGRRADWEDMVINHGESGYESWY